jgi:hypothetical protein
VYSEVYALDHKSPVDGSVKTTYYMKGVTKIENLSWLNNLGSDLLIQRSMPIHEHNSQSLNSLESRRALLVAKALASSKLKKKKSAQVTGLITHHQDQLEVYSQIYFGRKMWKLSVEQIPLSMLKPQFKLSTTG